MASYWPWLAVAGVGALHGLNPATGWMFAVASGLHSRDRARALRALMPIAIGHATSVALVAGAIAIGLSMDRVVMQVVAGGLLAVVAICHLSGRTAKRVKVRGGNAGLALWSFMMSSAHGAGLMLVPVLMPLCTGNASAREITASGSLTLALAAVGVHTAAMLAVTGVIVIGVCSGFDAGARLFRNHGVRSCFVMRKLQQAKGSQQAKQNRLGVIRLGHQARVRSCFLHPELKSQLQLKSRAN